MVDRWGGLDVVVANAGIGAVGAVDESTDDEWHRVLDLNVVGTARTVRAALPHLRASASAAVTVTCSVAATAGLPRRAVYSASKGALDALTRAMAADHLADGIRINGVAPGTADTPVGRTAARRDARPSHRTRRARGAPADGATRHRRRGRPRDRLPRRHRCRVPPPAPCSPSTAACSDSVSRRADDRAHLRRHLRRARISPKRATHATRQPRRPTGR